MAIRPDSTPFMMRRGCVVEGLATSAWISASSGRRPSMVTVTAVNVDASLERAEVFYSSLSADEDGRSEEVAEALEELRWPIQKLVNKVVRARRTPQIQFRPDTVLTSALRIDEILRDMSDRGEFENTASEDPDTADVGDTATPDEGLQAG